VLHNTWDGEEQAWWLLLRRGGATTHERKQIRVWSLQPTLIPCQCRAHKEQNLEAVCRSLETYTRLQLEQQPEGDPEAKAHEPTTRDHLLTSTTQCDHQEWATGSTHSSTHMLTVLARETYSCLSPRKPESFARLTQRRSHDQKNGLEPSPRPTDCHKTSRTKR
jgi:hypothetical protein